MNLRKRILVASLLTLLVAAPVLAQWGSWGGGAGVAQSLVCLVAGGADCTMTGGTVYSGVSVDISTPGAEDLTLAPGGVTATAKPVRIRSDTATQLTAGSVGNVFLSVNTGAAVSVPSIAVVAGRFGYDGTGNQVEQCVWRAKTPVSPTDTTTEPQHRCITLSSTGASAWTPGEANAVNGECFKAINTGTDVITMTASAGQYVGTVALGQDDVVEACYQNSRWVQTNTMNN